MRKMAGRVSPNVAGALLMYTLQGDGPVVPGVVDDQSFGPPIGKPDISVIISVKDRYALMQDCLQSFTRQTLDRARFEIVVVDNVSRDDILGLCRQYGDAGLSVRYLRMAIDKGPAPARNRGVAVSRGSVLAFTDSDCRPDAIWLERKLSAFDDPAIAFTTGPVLPKPEQRATLSSKLSFVTAEEHPTFPTANMAIRAEIFRAFEGFDESLSFRDPFDRAVECADTDLAWRVIKAGYRRSFDSSAIIRHEVEQQSIRQWIIEPTRLFLVPALVRRHPELRKCLLTARLFFYPPIWLLYAACGIFAAGLVWYPLLLLLLPVALIMRGVSRTRSIHPRRLVFHGARVLAHLPRMLVMTISLLYGSIRYRSLVL